MIQHHYATHEEYTTAQIEGNAKKLDRVWAREANIRWLAEHVVPAGAHFGICHGTRTGREVRWFAQALQGACMVVGTEISPASVTPGTICHDFAEPHALLSLADFVYSNSHDHARDPEATMRLWFSQLRPGGVLILEHTDYHEVLNAGNGDCWAVTITELMACLRLWLGITADNIDMPERHPFLRYCRAVVARRPS